MSNPDTLIPLNTRPEDERRTIQSKGGKASVRARLKKKAGKELVRAILAMRVTDPQILDEIRKEGVVADGDMTKEVAMHVRQIQKAIRKADTKAYSAVMKAAGYTEDDGVNINIATEEPPVIVFGDTSQPEND